MAAGRIDNHGWNHPNQRNRDESFGCICNFDSIHSDPVGRRRGAAKSLKEAWRDLRDRHHRFNYRTWITDEARPEAADRIGDATTFTLGGHEFGHLHVQWARTDAGWRIGRVFYCR